LSNDLPIAALGNSTVSVAESIYAQPMRYNNGSFLGLDNIQMTEDISGSPASPILTGAQSPIFSLVDVSFYVDILGVGAGVIESDGSVSGSYPSLLQILSNSNQIPSRSVGYTAGAFYST
jgi:hypothetical protein